jgi:DNA ligase-1
VRTVEPRIILEVTFDRVQASKRHKSGYALRFPRILRLRSDKSVDEIDTLDAVSRLAGESDAGDEASGDVEA